MKTILICALVALAAGSAAVAQVTPYTSVDQTKANPNNPDKLVCERETDIGSRLAARKVCMTAQQWRDKHNEQRGFAEDMQAGARARDSAVELAPGSAISGQGPQ